MPRILLATQNLDKVKEIRSILGLNGWEIFSLRDFPQFPPIEEDGASLLENAQKKARMAHQWTGMLSLADDTGLEVDALNGAPGVYSSRFAGETATYQENIQKLLHLLEGVPEFLRTARFRCVVDITDGIQEAHVEGVCEGSILSECRGEGGFGYDPVFYVPEIGKTFAEMTLEEKNAISHRGKAFRKAVEIVKNWYPNRGVAQSG